MRYIQDLKRSVYLGTLLLGITPMLAITPARAAKTTYVDGYSLAFVDADIRRVVDAVLGSMLNVDYTLDPDISGNITLRTTSPVPAEQLLPLLERALASVDAVVVDRKGTYFVVPRKKARALASFIQPKDETEQQPGEEKKAESPSGYASESIILRFAGAEELSRIAADIIGPDIIETGATGSNELIIRGTLEEREAARKLIARFDIDNLANMNFEIWKLDDVDADTIVSELETIFQPPYDIIGSRIRLIPLPRLRSILAIAPDRRDISRIEPWVRKLDQGGSAKRKLYNYAVQNGRARDMARSLQLVLAGSASGSDEPASLTQNNQASNSDQGGPGNEQSGPGSDGGSNFRASARSQPVSNAVSSGGLRIVPNEQNNSLLIYANGEEYGFIRDALDKLDQPVAQVLIEATLAEVTLTDDLRYGVDFQAIAGIGSTETTFTNSNNSSGIPAASFPGFAASVVGRSASGVLNTLQSKTNVRVLSAPKLLTLNNEPATLQVGDQVPIVIQQAQSVGSPGAPLVNTIELRDTGVILQVTPRINDSGTIILDISQEVSDVASTTTSGINSPTIQQRRLTSTVATRSGQMVALGGLIRNRQTREKAGVPLLSQIPVVGGLFGRKVDTGSRTELIILITPTIIRSPDEVKNAVDALINGLDLTRPLLDEAQQNLIGPKLPASRSEFTGSSENDYAQIQGQ